MEGRLHGVHPVDELSKDHIDDVKLGIHTSKRLVLRQSNEKFGIWDVLLITLKAQK